MVMKGTKAPKGKMLVIDASEGAGKTTQLKLLEDKLLEAGIAYVATREPGGTPLAEQIRDVILEPREEVMAHSAELLLVFAARAQHLERVIYPAINEGKFVICDRFTSSTYAYQGRARGLPRNTITQLEKLIQHDFRPDLTLVLDVDPEVGMERVGERPEKNRMEVEEMKFYQDVRYDFQLQAKRWPDRYCLIDASRPKEEVSDSIWERVEQLISG